MGAGGEAQWELPGSQAAGQPGSRGAGQELEKMVDGAGSGGRRSLRYSWCIGVTQPPWVLAGLWHLHYMKILAGSRDEMLNRTSPVCVLFGGLPEQQRATPNIARTRSSLWNEAPSDLAATDLIL